MEEGADPTIQTYSQNELEDGETCADWAYERGELPMNVCVLQINN